MQMAALLEYCELVCQGQTLVRIFFYILQRHSTLWSESTLVQRGKNVNFVDVKRWLIDVQRRLIDVQR